MNGAESLVRTLLSGGIDTCFANPGTSEMHFVAAVDQIPGIRCVLGLFEGVVAGAADGYARMADRPAATLLHCGPGLANGLANFHNARRAHVPIVNIVGDHATYHRIFDSPLTADTEGWARPVSVWTRTATSAADVGRDAAAAIEAARIAPGGIATLVLPSDTAWCEGGVPGQCAPVPAAPLTSPGMVRNAATVLRRGEPTAIIVSGRALRAAPLAAAAAIAQATGAKLLAMPSNARIERGHGRYPVARIPYVLDQAIAELGGMKHLILVGTREPVAFFAYPGKPSRLAPPDAEIHVLARPEHDLGEALARLRDELGVHEDAPAADAASRPEPARGDIGPEALGRSLAALIPEHSILVDESITFGRSFFADTRNTVAHDWLQLTGGAIGDGLPLATGAAIGAPGRRIVSMQADGSALYTVQALWTQARERLDVTTVILANHKYRILLHELAAVGANPGRTALEMLDLSDPSMNWVKIANGFGVEAARADSMDEFNRLFAQANGRPGPFVIELSIG